uniref:CR-type domain-containing protein n=1 Tax=Chromera velia CCMP2878 TaxID=1169474 RepID=A0A0G4GI81_9ALVE|eukprot:Cvel_22005.t1-p1 / transcript=Cvel_22005.t1 / gene=Cvel_22005 / organism=Chromera_velia_CCMP2878 / gene_product=Zinc finger protein 420, putative / transcript_product=Zinc finger protein 420, putative / location=Cvel_scaffold2121:19542-20702(+) / protein_length=387 / sequence_SO=supercontig / SO=protein_coding / is_pseudo=false
MDLLWGVQGSAGEGSGQTVASGQDADSVQHPAVWSPSDDLDLPEPPRSVILPGGVPKGSVSGRGDEALSAGRGSRRDAFASEFVSGCGRGVASGSRENVAAGSVGGEGASGGRQSVKRHREVKGSPLGEYRESQDFPVGLSGRVGAGVDGLVCRSERVKRFRGVGLELPSPSLSQGELRGGREVLRKSHCSHGRLQANCKDCGGKNICVHGRLKYQCKPCGGKNICPHNRQKSQCKDCGGKSICEHKRQRANCKECGGKNICEHSRQRSHCKECGGKSICQHNRQRANCKDCRGKNICEHSRQRSQCRDCRGGSMCSHDRQRFHCKDCKRSSSSAHERPPSQSNEGPANATEAEDEEEEEEEIIFEGDEEEEIAFEGDEEEEIVFQG